MFFGLEFGTTYHLLASDLDPATRTSWQASLTAAANYLINSGDTTWYANGNINLGYTEFLYLVWQATGNTTYEQAYNASWNFTMNPPKNRFPGSGLVITQQPTQADGSDGMAYLTEAGVGGNGFDPDYTQTQLDTACRLYLLSERPARAAPREYAAQHAHAPRGHVDLDAQHQRRDTPSAAGPRGRFHDLGVCGAGPRRRPMLAGRGHPSRARPGGGVVSPAGRGRQRNVPQSLRGQHRARGAGGRRGRPPTRGTVPQTTNSSASSSSSATISSSATTTSAQAPATSTDPSTNSYKPTTTAKKRRRRRRASLADPVTSPSGGVPGGAHGRERTASIRPDAL